MKKYNIVYQITNKLDNNIYIGCHQTDNIDDGYMGSGTYLKRAMKKYGEKNFERIILENFDTPEEMFKKEKYLVNDNFIKRKDTYNLTEGGEFINSTGKVTVKDKKGNTSQVSVKDPRYLSGELVHALKGKIMTVDTNGKYLSVSVNDPRYLSGELKSILNKYMHYINIKDIFGNYCCIAPEEYYKNKQKYMGNWTGKRHNAESKKKIGKANSKAQKGKGNSQYGTCWIHNLELEESKKIKKPELKTWISKNWIKGRKMYFN